MGTQAVISLVRDGETHIKVVAGCNGQEAEAVAREIIQYMTVTDHIETKDIYDIARELKLGCDACLVVMDKQKIIYEGTEEFSDELRNNYRETFDDPKINPRIMFKSEIERNVKYLFIVPVTEGSR